ncbi:MAG: hypothetical protein RLZZ297_736 [Chloroflexota bacterium]
MDTTSTPLADASGLSAERRATLRAIAPELFPGGGDEIDIDALLAYYDLSSEPSAKESFGLDWVGRHDAMRAAGLAASGTLVPAERSDSQNLIIEGDNLEVLRILRKSYSGRVKLIYIDPPYNTGNDFVYPDNYAEPVADYLRRAGAVDAEGVATSANTRSDGRFHAKWLTMMYPRLVLARELLRDDGVIFVSIDDNEVHNLRAVMNEIFGEENFVGNIKRRAARKTAFLSNKMTDMCDYVVIYQKSDDVQALTAGSVSDDTRPVFNQGNKITSRIVRVGTPARCQDCTIKKNKYATRSLEFELTADLVIKDGRTENEVTVFGPWRINQDVLDKTLFVTSNNGLRRNLLEEEKLQGKLLNDLLDDANCYNEAGSELLSLLLNRQSVFDNPKPIGLINYLISAVNSDTDGIIMDFFAGSGTTAHAVMEKNAADGGARKFVLVQFPETLNPANKNQKTAAEFCDSIGKPRTIAEITKERVRRAAAKIRSENPLFAGDLGFSSYKLTPAHILPLKPVTHANIASATADMFAERLAAGWTIDGLCSEVLLREGFPLTASMSEVHGWRCYTAPTVGFPLYINLTDPIGSVAALCGHLAAETGHRGVNKRHGVAVCLDRALSTVERVKLAEYVTIKTI